jgi:hypothetical protein
MRHLVMGVSVDRISSKRKFDERGPSQRLLPCLSAIVSLGQNKTPLQRNRGHRKFRLSTELRAREALELIKFG